MSDVAGVLDPDNEPPLPVESDPGAGKEYHTVTCQMCGDQYEYSRPKLVQNTDGSSSWSVEDVIVLFVNEAGDDYYPGFFCKNLCASAWAYTNNMRLQRPSSFPARYYEAIEEDPDPMQRATVKDQQQTDQVAKMPRSRLV